MAILENILIGFVGRPILLIIKWFRWYFFSAGVLFNTIDVYDPVTKTITDSQLTVLPLICGIILLAIGTVVKRYDEIYEDYVDLPSKKRTF